MKSAHRHIHLLALCALLAVTGIPTSSHAYWLNAEFISPSPDSVFQTHDSICIAMKVWYDNENYTGGMPGLLMVKGNLIPNHLDVERTFYPLGPDPDHQGTYYGIMVCYWDVPFLRAFNSEFPQITQVFPVFYGRPYDISIEVSYGDSLPISLLIYPKGEPDIDDFHESKSASTTITTFDNVKALYR